MKMLFTILKKQIERDTATAMLLSYAPQWLVSGNNNPFGIYNDSREHAKASLYRGSGI